LEQQIQDEKCAELEAAGLIKPAPPGSKYASECTLGYPMHVSCLQKRMQKGIIQIAAFVWILER